MSWIKDALDAARREKETDIATKREEEKKRVEETQRRMVIRKAAYNYTQLIFEKYYRNVLQDLNNSGYNNTSLMFEEIYTGNYENPTPPIENLMNGQEFSYVYAEVSGRPAFPEGLSVVFKDLFGSLTLFPLLNKQTNIPFAVAVQINFHLQNDYELFIIGPHTSTETSGSVLKKILTNAIRKKVRMEK